MDLVIERPRRRLGRAPASAPAPLPDPGQTLVDLFFDRVDRWSGRVALRHVSEGDWASIRWAEYSQAVREVAAGLVDLGIEPGDRVGILAGNQPRWHIVDLGILAAGAISVPAYPTAVAGQVSYVFRHSGARLAFVGDRDQLSKVLVSRHELDALERIVLLGDRPDGLDDDTVSSFEELCERGRRRLTDEPDVVDQRSRALRPDDVATLVYTSGTTGPPKGTMLTHRNVSETIRSLMQVVSVGPSDRFLSFLPLSHIAERLVGHMCQIASGGETWFARQLATVPEDLRACRPTIVFAVPRVWEKFHQEVLRALTEAPGIVRRAVQRFIELGRATVEAGEGRRLPPGRREHLTYRLLDRTVGARIRRQMGMDQGKYFVSSAAAIDADLLCWFHAIGIPIAEVYGQTEDCGPTTMNRPGRIRIGTVGEPLPGVEVRIADDGEILVRGGNVCLGYWDDPEATAALLRDGWMHSGDLGSMDDGYLRITGRKKDLIVTSTGKNVAPQDMETRLRHEPFISQAVVVGDGRKFLAALLSLDTDAIADATGAHDEPEILASHPEVERAIARAVGELNRTLARAEQVKTWRILPRDLTVADGELTPTLKVRRSEVIDRYAALVEEMYAT